MQQKKNFLRILKWMALAVLAILLYLAFWPRHYDVPKRDNSINQLRWQIHTGSVIGYTHIAGKGNKQPYPIVYLHGGPGGGVSATVMNNLKPLSDNGYDLYFYDQAGCGASGRLSDIADYTLERHVKDLDEIIDSTGSGKVILLGQSWGAILAAAFAAAHPGKVAKLIFTSPGPIYPVRKNLLNIQAPDSLHIKAPLTTNKKGSAAADNLRMKTVRFFAVHFTIKLAGDDEADDFACYESSFTNQSALCDTSIHLPARGGYGFYSGLITFNNLQHIQDFRPGLKGNAIPSLVLKGQCDNQPWGATSEYLELFPNHHFVLIPNAGHFIAIEQGEIYLREIEGFLRKE